MEKVKYAPGILVERKIYLWFMRLVLHTTVARGSNYLKFIAEHQVRRVPIGRGVRAAYAARMATTGSENTVVIYARRMSSIKS